MGSFLPPPEDEDIDALQCKVVAAQEARMREAELLVAANGMVDNLFVLHIRVETFLDFIVPKEADAEGNITNPDRLRLELRYEETLTEVIKDALKSARQAKLQAFGNGRRGLIVPGQ